MRKILIVDDNETNRCILSEILCEDYEILEAENGRDAISVLNREYKGVSAVLLDIIMPVMDGYETLAEMRADAQLSKIPVIVTTSSSDGAAEEKALALGANDFITKPYNIEIIKHRLKNTINLRETAAAYNALRKDELTGLPTRRVFFEEAAKLIAGKPAGYYVMTCFDVNKFKVLNELYGSEKCDDVLRFIADNLTRVFSAIGGICCRIAADHFAVLYPAKYMNSKNGARIIRRTSEYDGSIPPMAFSIGRYVIDDISLPVSAMYDRASMARASVKGRFDKSIADYDDSMRTRLLREQKITSTMKDALETGQFEVWFQPQFSNLGGAMVGAEALVRWRRREDGRLVPPDEFIPVFERNGFIYELDKYVWEQSCALLRKWLDAGGSPVPVSVNISRYDIFRCDFVDVITGLLEKYSLPIDMLRLEITESAFVESTEQIVAVVDRLIKLGFCIEIDDFGSGYSSLNTLKDVPAHVLKLDMRFLEGRGASSQRGDSVMESIVGMAHLLGMSVIAEGVETAEQADYLKSIGCAYMQGYLYAKPMPAKEYETLAGNSLKETKGPSPRPKTQ